MIALSSFVFSLSVIVTVVATAAVVALFTVVPWITEDKEFPPIVIASASNVPSISASPLISKLVASISPLPLKITLSPPSTSKIIWLSVENFIWLSSSLPISKAVFFIDVMVVCAGVTIISSAFAVIPSPPITFNVTDPEDPPPVNPVPAVTPSISPEPLPPPYSAKVKLVVSMVISPSVVNWNILSLLSVPSSINTNELGRHVSLLSISVDLVGKPVVFTT